MPPNHSEAKVTIRDELLPAVAIVRGVVPDPVPEHAYWAIIVAGHREMSNRSVVELVVHLTGKDEYLVLNDVYRVGAGELPDLDGLAECAEALRIAGL